MCPPKGVVTNAYIINTWHGVFFLHLVDPLVNISNHGVLASNLSLKMVDATPNHSLLFTSIHFSLLKQASTWSCINNWKPIHQSFHHIWPTPARWFLVASWDSPTLPPSLLDGVHVLMGSIICGGVDWKLVTHGNPIIIHNPLAYLPLAYHW